jgi:trehalose/maltose hydrolase-like predicted phosphorylase
MNPWTLRYEGYEPHQEGLREALCVVGNGYMATRAAAPESVADGTHYPGTYAAGVFNRLESEIEGRMVGNESMVNLPNWLVLSLRVDDGPWFHIDQVEVLDYVQELDLRRAVLTRRVRYRDGDDRTTELMQRSLVSMDAPHVCALESTIVAKDWSGRLQVRSLIDGDVENTLVERYRDLPSHHLEVVSMGRPAEDVVLLEVETNQTQVRIAMAARTRLYRHGAPVSAECRELRDEASIGLELTLDMSVGDAVTVEKIVSVYTSRDPAISAPAVQACRWIPRLGDFEALLEAHESVWAHLWDRFHIGATDSEESMRTLRLHLLHLLQTVSPNSEDLDVGVPARGLHGEAYRGHIFWDELFVFPILNLRIPALTRSLLGYRYRRLPEARQAARAAGFEGAMFPWQSGSDGREETQILHLNPESGRWNPDATHLQRHIGVAIAYNVWQYHQVTDDREFFERYGAELLVDIARFWSSIASFDEERDRYVICGVVGPDEFHTRYPDAHQNGLDNNAYTNLMAAWVLLRANEALDRLCDRSRRELMDKLDLKSTDLQRWQDITRKMYVPFHGDGIISQFEGYEDLEELDWDHYRHEYGDIRRLDRILEAEDDTPNRYKVSKQADVLMLFYLLSADELRELFEHLGYELDPDMIRRNIDYYIDRTSHGSTLSSVVHAWVLARTQRERAVEHFEMALAADVSDIQGGTTPEGIHLAAMCGSVDLLQRCFSGLETRGDRLLLNPYWPESLGSLSLAIQYRDLPLELHITGDRVSVTAGPGVDRTIQVGYRNEFTELKAGTSVEFRR